MNRNGSRTLIDTNSEARQYGTRDLNLHSTFPHPLVFIPGLPSTHYKRNPTRRNTLNNRSRQTPERIDSLPCLTNRHIESTVSLHLGDLELKPPPQHRQSHSYNSNAGLLKYHFKLAESSINNTLANSYKELVKQDGDLRPVEHAVS
jgi:hypothetical protein